MSQDEQEIPAALAEVDPNEPLDPIRDAWPRDWMAPFIAHMRWQGNVRSAAESAGVARETVVYWRSKLPRFREAWDSALEYAIDRLEGEAWQRAMANPRADQLLWNLLSAVRRERYGQKVEVQVRVTEQAKALGEQYGFTPAEILAEAEAIVAGTASLPGPKSGV